MSTGVIGGGRNEGVLDRGRPLLRLFMWSAANSMCAQVPKRALCGDTTTALSDVGKLLVKGVRNEGCT